MDNQATEAKQIGDHVAELFGFMSKTDQQFIREAVHRAMRKAALKAIAKTYAVTVLLDGQPYTAVCLGGTTSNFTAEKLAEGLWTPAQGTRTEVKP